jgi:carbon-monoxide dehydrogenase small subunit
MRVVARDGSAGRTDFVRVSCTVNGKERSADDVGPGASLATLLHDHFALTGTKSACSQGECGSCSVLVNGTLACSCLISAGRAEGAQITTIEGLGAADGSSLNAIQRAFAEAGAVQCGFCTPGLIMACHALLSTESEPDDETVRDALAGNLCRCTGYVQVLEAVRQVISAPRTSHVH